MSHFHRVSDAPGLNPGASTHKEYLKRAVKWDAALTALFTSISLRLEISIQYLLSFLAIDRSVD